MPPKLIQNLLEVSEYLAKNCIHDKIIITVEGVSVEQTKEFHPASETLLD
ncbi:hypothetical protein [Streptococcus ovis]|nr:hypothetical protein [Streptococcus ovis]